MPRNRLKFNRQAWQQLVKEVVNTDGVDRMSRVADACNSYIEDGGYKVSVEGDQPLSKRSYRATVITTTRNAMEDNADHGRLVSNLFQAGGD